MKSFKDKQLVLGLLFLGLVAGAMGGYFEQQSASLSNGNGINQAAAILATEQNLTSTLPPPPEITLGFAGDIMLDRGVRLMVEKNLDGDYAKLFENADFLKKPDIMFANLEGVVSDKGADLHNLYSFRMDPKVLAALKDSGVDVVSVANNHIGDWKRVAFEDSLKRIRETGILPCGGGMNKTEAKTPAIVSQEGFTVGYLCFSDVGPEYMEATDTQSGILLASDKNFDAIVRNAAQKVNTLIVSFHYGIEYKTTHNARQEELAKAAIDDGAALVVGSHPHVAQEIATYSGAPILYSLGNFIFDQKFSDETSHGLFVTATLSGRTISNLVPHVIQIGKNFAPSLEQ